MVVKALFSGFSEDTGKSAKTGQRIEKGAFFNFL
jgi:hypothetical protein